MQVTYVCPYWGQEHLAAGEFLDKAVAAGYDGVEINLPENKFFLKEFLWELDSLRADSENDFVFIGQQVLSLQNESATEYTNRMQKRLQFLSSLQPLFINSHTGKDHFSFDDNCRIIEKAMNISAKTGVRILHETHRGRFTFHAASLLPYLEKFPGMELVGDFSHWCNVSESLLQDQSSIIEKIIPHIGHIHARLGFEHSPQVSDPFAPEWKDHLATFIEWWKKIVCCQHQKNKEQLTICPEAGPPPYMPTLPFTQQAIGDQWKINVEMRDYLKGEFMV
jgi:sugar phosphate isomerase/epimerase